MCLWNLMNDLRSGGGGSACEWLALGPGDDAPSAKILVRWLELRWEELAAKVGLEQPVGSQTMTAAQLSVALRSDRGSAFMHSWLGAVTTGEQEGAHKAHGMPLALT
jgi:hypothetical protein